jgi:hypothetical protein
MADGQGTNPLLDRDWGLKHDLVNLVAYGDRDGCSVNGVDVSPGEVLPSELLRQHLASGLDQWE